nr:AIR synthase-related protein [uncultured Brumimicrobium sp.]
MENTTQREATLEDAKQLGLNKTEFESVKTLLGRTPNYIEVIVYGEMWSENLSFKNSIKHLSALPTIKSVDLENGTQFSLTIENKQYKKHKDSTKQAIAKVTSYQLGNIEDENTIPSIKKTVETANKTTTTDGRNVFFDKSFNNNAISDTFSLETATTTDQSQDKLELLKNHLTKIIASHIEASEKDITVEQEKELIQCSYKNKIIVNIPLSTISVGEGTPVYDREHTEPDYFQEYKTISIDDIPEPEDLREVATYLLRSPNIASKRWFNNQIGTRKSIPENTSVKPLENEQQAIALTTTCQPRYVHADPETGAAICIAEASRKIICAGGTPKATALSLNFGNPYNPETYWQFVNTIKGLTAACTKFNTPVLDKNMSFNNVSMVDGKETAILPSPNLGMMGIIEDRDKVMTPDFKHKGDLIFIIGEAVECIASSEYLFSYHNHKKSPAPYFNLEKELATQLVVKSLIQKDLINAAHDCSRGGLFITLTEMSMSKELGFDIVTDAEIREDAFLFGEASGRIIVGVNEDSEDDFIEYMMNAGVNYTLLGHVTQGKLVVDDIHYGFIQAAKTIYNTAIEKTIG